MKYLIWFLIALLIVLHQDYWQWNDTTLLFGFLPRTLAYHAGLSIAAAGVWWLATVVWWPEKFDDRPATPDVGTESDQGKDAA